VKLKKLYHEKDFEFGGRAILTFEGEESSNRYQLIISVFQPTYLLCLEWFDGVNSHFLDCENLNAFVPPHLLGKWFLKTLTEKLGTELTNSIKQIIDNREFDEDLEEIKETLEKHSIHLEWLIRKEKTK